MDFRDRVVVITGGSRGLGLVLARQLADEGAHLALLARDAVELNRAERGLTGGGARVLVHTCDVRDRIQVEQSIQAISRHYGRIDVLINNAGVIGVGPLDNLTLEDFEDSLATHVWGPLYATRAVLPLMRRQGGGRIVNISSIGGKLALPHLLPYVVGKFGLVGLSDGLQAELARDKIWVTTVCPGLMRTGSHVNASFKGNHELEFLWFSTAAGLPGISMPAEQAASQILDACRRGKAEVVISLPARAASLFLALLPEVTARLLALVNRCRAVSCPAGRSRRKHR